MTGFIGRIRNAVWNPQGTRKKHPANESQHPVPLGTAREDTGDLTSIRKGSATTMSTQKNVGDPGWVGNAVVVKGLNNEKEPEIRTIVYLDPENGIACDNARFMKEWEKGIVGRGNIGRVYPQDGQKFLDELPFIYKSPYLWAEPVNPKKD